MILPQALQSASIRQFFENPLVLSPMLSWAMAQLIKAVIALLSRPRRRVREIIAILVWRTGGMPSSHAALVSAMAAAAAFKDGIGSDLFVVCVWFAVIIIRDAMGVRRATGMQARSINTLGRHTADKLGIDFHPVKEIDGHSPLQVAVGALLGIFIAAAFAWL
jgi:acid phosphatase family membrane protein YuiD